MSIDDFSTAINTPQFIEPVPDHRQRQEQAETKFPTIAIECGSEEVSGVSYKTAAAQTALADGKEGKALP